MTWGDEKVFSVYIMTNRRQGTLYVGVTNSMRHRIWQHKNNLIKGFTSKYDLHRLVFFENYESIQTAIEREKQIKNWKRQWKIELIESVNPQWRDLYEEVY